MKKLRDQWNDAKRDFAPTSLEQDAINFWLDDYLGRSSLGGHCRVSLVSLPALVVPILPITRQRPSRITRRYRSPQLLKFGFEILVGDDQRLNRLASITATCSLMGQQHWLEGHRRQSHLIEIGDRWPDTLATQTASLNEGCASGG
jgi:hypothetical protein